MHEIVKEYDIKNIYNNECMILYNEVLEGTKLSNQIIVLVANRPETRKPESEAFLQPL
jgi:hypothetical protein